jgi:hypothetical protein
MTNEQFKRIATLFSIILVFDVVILPLVIVVLKNDANYPLLKSLTIYLVGFFILGVFWIIGLCEIYAVFFAKTDSKRFFIIRIFVDLAKKGYRNNQLSKSMLILQTLLIWGGVAYVFLYEIYKILELLILD